MATDFTYAVVGAGIVGLSTAYHLLAADPAATVVVLEAEDAVGRHQTGHNSGVIHSGIYYEPGSLKARFSRAGERATKAFCREHGIAFARGTRVEIDLDEEQFVGTGAYTFSAMLDVFLGLYTSINSFSQLVVRTRQRKRILKQWPPRSGQKILL